MRRHTAVMLLVFALCALGLFAQQGNFPPGGGSSAFNAITSGTNTTAAMVCGTGCSLATSGTGTISGTPAGSNTQLQYNNNGAFGADAGIVWSGSLLTLKPASGSCPISAQNSGGTPEFSGVTSGGFCEYTFGHNLTVTNALTSASYNSASNCSSNASPAVCGSSASGSVVVAAAATTVQVNTTAVTANSQVQLTFDSSLGTKLAVTCNTTPVQPTVSARTGGSNFTITVPTAPTTNPACFSYTIMN